MHKCGSSAIQQALSVNPVLHKQTGGRFLYAAINPAGDLLHGSALKRCLPASAESYVSTASWRELAKFDEVRMTLLRIKLGRICKADDMVILSNEGWGHKFAVFQRERILERLGLNCHVVIYVRPQVAWVNSAWWQWGVWEDMPFQQWVNTRRLEWHRVAEGWRNTPRVDKVTVRLLPRDIVTDFSGVIGSVLPEHLGEANVSLPGTVLRVLQRHRHLRPEAHSSEIEFVLARHLSMPKGKTPWVVPRPLIEKIIKQFSESNRMLLDYLDDEQKKIMMNDPAWWSAEFYADRRAEPLRAILPSAVEMDQLLASSFEALLNLDRQNRRLAAEKAQPLWKRLSNWLKTPH